MRFKRLLIAAICTLILNVAAQTFAIPPEWTNTTSSVDRHNRLDLVDELSKTLVRNLNASDGLFEGFGVPESAHILHALSTFDFINGTTPSYEDDVMTALNAMLGSTPNITSAGSLLGANSSALEWGVASINAYRAYGDPSLIKYAESMWEQGSVYMITPEDAAAGKHPTRNVSIQSTCSGTSTAGGVFYDTSRLDDTDVRGESTGALFLLSARLYNQTSDAQYLSTALLTLNFIMNHLYTGSVILDNINLSSCNQSNVLVTQDSGWVIDGLTTLVAFNDSYLPFLSDLVSAAANPAWTDPQNGIITEGPTSSDDPNALNSSFPLKGILIRGLYERYNTISTDSPEANFIRSYITVQFNALISLASTPGSNQYSPQWEGPPPVILAPYGQLAASDVLISAVGLLDVHNASSRSNSTSSSSDNGGGGGGATSGLSPASPTSSSSIHQTDTRHTISGGVIGGIAAAGVLLLILLVILLLFLRRRSRRRLENERILALETSAQPYRSNDWTQSLEHGGSGVAAIEGVRQPIATKYSGSRYSEAHRGRSTRSFAPARSHHPSSSLSASNITTSDSSRNLRAGNQGSSNSNTSEVSSSVVLDLSSHPRLFARLTRAANAMVVPMERDDVDDEDLPRYEG